MALTIDRRSVSGETTGTVALDETIFGIQPNVPVMHQVVTAQLAAARAGTQSTKTRAEVSGGGKKPFKQKGTGRARQGSERAPHFTGGGVAFGPKPRSYKQKTPRKMIQLALRSALSDRANEDRIVVVDAWPWETPSTKSATEAIATLGLDGRILVVLSRDDERAYKSFRNLPEIQLMLVGELNAYDVLCSDWVVFTSETLPGANLEVDSAPRIAEGDPPAAESAVDAPDTSGSVEVAEEEAPPSEDEEAPPSEDDEEAPPLNDDEEDEEADSE